MHSSIFTGQIRHRRYLPRAHAFQYRLFMMYLDLDELDHVFDCSRLWSVEKRNLARFCRSDYLGNPQVPLKEAVSQLVAEHTGRPVAGPIRLLTHLRYFGHCFNPVSFYYCYDSTGRKAESVVAEINNTPWGERHSYVLDAARDAPDSRRFLRRFRKDFHVSPFMDMDIDYRWRFTQPGRRLLVHMENLRRGRLLFDATLSMKRRPITGPALRGLLLQFPFMTVKVIGAIYWNALRLRLKRIPFYSHPERTPGES